ncbi:MAG: hypothetical protein OXR84_05320 [Magnetovibrio sp.]|nr:hypothetical protein [Magnetovibrio sp.]
MSVITGLDPVIHDFACITLHRVKSWMPGSSPGMTMDGGSPTAYDSGAVCCILVITGLDPVIHDFT